MKEASSKKFPTHFHLELYKRSDKSGVKAFEAKKNYMIDEFIDGRIYLYDEQSPGTKHVENMKNAARKGKGLNTYINKYVRGKYIAKWNKDSKKFDLNEDLEL